jgi:acyl carrier protein
MNGQADRLHAVVTEVLGQTVDDTSSPETTEGWDSLNHLNIILAIEAEFDVQLTMDDALGAETVGAFRELLQAKGVAV